MADRRNLVFPLVFFLWIVLSPDPRPPGAQLEAQRRIHDVIAEEHYSLQVLQNSTYGDLRVGGPDPGYGLNLTGLEADRGFAWDALPSVKERAGELLQYALGDWGRDALENGDNGLDPPPLYHNVTGRVQGHWVRSKLQSEIPLPQLNLTAYTPEGLFGPLPTRQFGRNITQETGGVSLRFYERSRDDQAEHGLQAANATRMNAEMKVESEDGEQDWEILLRGVYYSDTGQAVLTTHSDKFAGVFMLPHMALSARTFEETKIIMNDSIARTIQSQVNGRVDTLNPWSTSTGDGSEPIIPVPNCELILYLQQLPLLSTGQAYPSVFLSFLERELRFPTGAFLPPAPGLRFSMLAFSPDCGYVIESKGEPEYAPQRGGTHLSGPKIEVLLSRGRHHLLLFTAVLALQLTLSMKQMREACTPSTRSRISFYTIAMLALGDGFATMTFCLTSLFIGSLWVNLIGTAFLSFLSVSFFGMRFLMDIWSVQAPERARRERERMEEERRRMEEARESLRAARERRLAIIAAAAPEQTVGTLPNQDATAQQQDTPDEPATPGTLPLPVTAPRPTDTGATPVFMPSDQEGLEPVEQDADTLPIANAPATVAEPQLQSFGALYTRFYLLLLGTLFLSLNASAWPSAARRVYFTLLALAYLSFWLPQIQRNVQRNCRKALLWKYVAGQSVLRLVPFAYFYGYDDNVLFATVDLKSLALLAAWVWCQVLVLASQELVGPRWFVRRDWAPPAYDYHPVLRLDEEGATLPLGMSQSTAAAAVVATSAPASPVHERRFSSAAADDAPLARRASIAKESREKGKRLFDCAICMQELEVPVIEADGRGGDSAGSAGSLLARRTYMVTPCRHIFHSSCLEGWMKYRLQCPICREGLPPL